MDKIAIKDYATEPLNRAQLFRALLFIETQINRGSDGYLFAIKRITTADSPYTMNLNDSILICDSSAGSITINLLPALEWEQKRLTVKKINSGHSIILDANGSETIDGSGTYTITSHYASHDFVSQGGDIHVI